MIIKSNSDECRHCIFYWEDMKFCYKNEIFLPIKKCEDYKEEENKLLKGRSND